MFVPSFISLFPYLSPVFLPLHLFYSYILHCFHWKLGSDIWLFIVRCEKPNTDRQKHFCILYFVHGRYKWGILCLYVFKKISWLLIQLGPYMLFLYSTESCCLWHNETNHLNMYTGLLHFPPNDTTLFYRHNVFWGWWRTLVEWRLELNRYIDTADNLGQYRRLGTFQW